MEVTWDEWRLAGAPGSYLIGQAGQGVRLTTGPEGTWRACAVPSNTRLTVIASWGPFTGEPDTLRIPEDRPVDVHEARLGVAAGSTIRGIITARGSARPVSGAELRFTSVEDPDAAARVVVADADGRFAVRHAGAGRYALTASSLGYAEITDTVEAVSGRVNHLTIDLPEEAMEIEGVTVEVEARIPRLDMSGYYERARQGLGVFMDADSIAEEPVTTPQELFRNTPGVRVRYTSGQTGSRPVLTINGCMPTVFLDGTRVRRPENFDLSPNPRHRGAILPVYLDDLVTLSAIEGIEVFRSPAELPIEYAGTETHCGVILIWTR